MGKAEDLKSKELAGLQVWMKTKGIDPDVFSMENYMSVILGKLDKEYEEEVRDLRGFQRVMGRLTTPDLEGMVKQRKDAEATKIAMPNKNIQLVK